MNYLLFTIIFDLRICISFFAKQSEWEFGSGVEGSQVEKKRPKQNKGSRARKHAPASRQTMPLPSLRPARLCGKRAREPARNARGANSDWPSLAEEALPKETSPAGFSGVSFWHPRHLCPLIVYKRIPRHYTWCIETEAHDVIEGGHDAGAHGSTKTP